MGTVVDSGGIRGTHISTGWRGHGGGTGTWGAGGNKHGVHGVRVEHKDVGCMGIWGARGAGGSTGAWGAGGNKHLGCEHGDLGFRACRVGIGIWGAGEPAHEVRGVPCSTQGRGAAPWGI